MRRKQRFSASWGIAYVAIVLLAHGARALSIAYADLSFDEVATVYVANRPLLDVLQYLLGASREHPPVYYVGMSLWFAVAGTSEFVTRYPSTLIGVLTTAWGIQVGKRFFSKEGGLWSGLFLAVLPFSVWAGRNGRMYSLVILLALINLDLYWRLVQHPNWRLGGAYLLTTLLGTFTHYYLILLWPAEGVLLLLLPRKTRRLRKFWLFGTVCAGTLLGVFLWISPGARATFLEVANRFPTRTFRLQDLKHALMDIYLYWHYPTLNVEFWIVVGLTILGWIVAWRHNSTTAVLLATTSAVPILITHFIPAAIEARYLTLIVPGLVLSLTAALVWLRPHWLRAVLIILVLFEINARWERLRFPPDTTFSSQIARLHQAVQPGDALVMNGPWPALLLTYYEPPKELPIYRIPETAPPGFEAEIDIPRLKAISSQHPRLWVSYGSVEPTDPQYGVSHWLAQNMYAVERFHNLTLYVPPPEQIIPISEPLELAPQLQLREVAINRQAFTPGEFLITRMIWEGPDLSWRIRPSLALRDDQGNVWLKESFTLGPIQKDENKNLTSPWNTQRGLRIEPGIPPGTYMMSLQVESKGFPLTGGGRRSDWMPLTEVRILNGRSIPLTGLIQHQLYLPLILHRDGRPQQDTPTETEAWYTIPDPNEIEADFGAQLTLLGHQTEIHEIVQGYPLEITLWWKAKVDSPQAQLYLRLSHRDTPARRFDLGPTFYPVTAWQADDVVKQSITYPIPRSLPAGRYHVEVQLMAPDGTPLPISGSREALTFFERLRDKRHRLDTTWGSIDLVQVREAERSYRPPLFRQRENVRFSDVLKLRGYRIEKTTVKPGETIALTEYWEALSSPDRLYAVFNHLMHENGTLVWQKDSWPREGTYTTDFWVAGEVVAESYTMEIPADAPAGDCTLYVGTYDPKNPSVRLPAVDAEGERLLNDQVPLLTLTIAP